MTKVSGPSIAQHIIEHEILGINSTPGSVDISDLENAVEVLESTVVTIENDIVIVESGLQTIENNLETFINDTPIILLDDGLDGEELPIVDNGEDNSRNIVYIQTNGFDEIIDHGELDGLSDDDHPQYYNTARIQPIINDIATVSGIVQDHIDDATIHFTIGDLNLDDYATRVELLSVSGVLQNDIDNHTHTVSEITDIAASYQPLAAVLTNTTASFTTAQETKLGHIAVTQAVNLDTMESDIATNNAKVTNATHTGEVTGATTLTVDKTAITNKTLVSAAVEDHILIADTSDSENLKKVTVSGLLSGKADLSHTHTTSEITNFSSSVETLASGQYLKLDTSNGPLTGPLTGIEGTANDPSFQVSTGGIYAGTSPWGTPSLAVAASNGESVYFEPYVDGVAVTAEALFTTIDSTSYAGFSSAFNDQNIFAIADAGDATLTINSYAPGKGSYGSIDSVSGIAQLAIQGATRSWLAFGGGGTTSLVNISNVSDQDTGILFNGGNTFDLVASGLYKLRISNTALTTAANILPDIDSTRDIGSNSVRYSNVYADNLHGTISGYSAIGHTHPEYDDTVLIFTISGQLQDHIDDTTVHFTVSSLNLDQYVDHTELIEILSDYYPSGIASGDLDGDYPNPSVIAITDSGGNRLLIDGIADGDVLVRSGLNIIGSPLPIQSYQYTVTASGQISTTSTLDPPTVVAADMTISPGSGNYLVFFNSDVSNNTAGASVFTSIFVDDTELLYSEREFRNPTFTVTSGDVTMVTTPCSSHSNQGYVTVSGEQAVNIRWRVSGGTGILGNRALSLIKIEELNIPVVPAPEPEPPAPGLFIEDYVVGADFSTSSSSYVTALELDTTVTEGYYIIQWDGTIARTISGGVFGQSRVLINGVTVAESEEHFANESYEFPFSGFYYVLLSGAVNITIEVEGNGQQIDLLNPCIYILGGTE